MIFPRAAFEAFASKLRIPSKEQGVVPLRLLGTQRYLIMEIARGLEDGIHDFLALKGRQQGISTVGEALDLFWPMKHEGLQGQVVTESEGTFAYFREVILAMLASLPNDYRLAVKSNNVNMLTFMVDGKAYSRLMYQVAGKTKATKGLLGRSRGLNYLHATECGSWTDQEGVAALEASLAEHHPQRLYLWEGTARGFDVWHQMWEDAQHSVTRRAVFIGWWRKEDYAVARGTALWDAYGDDELSDSERLWVHAIQRRYGVEITAEQIAWYRYQLAEKFRHDDAMLAQEHPCLPEDAFQAFGDKFFGPSKLQKMRLALENAPVPLGLQFVWSEYWDQTEVKEVDLDDAEMVVWEQPHPGTEEDPAPGVYLVSAKSAYSDDADQPEDVAIVWRIYPDQMVQVAEYVTEDSDILKFAWLLLHLCGAYRMTKLPTYLAYEVQGTGQGVLAEIKRMENHGHGISPALRPRRRELFDFAGSINNYLWTKPDSLTSTPQLQWQSTPARRPMIMHALRGQIAREQLVIRSPKFLNQLASIRRGEDGDNDRIAAGGVARDGRVIAAGIGAWFYLETIVAELSRKGIQPKDPPRFAPRHVGEHQLQQFIQRKLLSGVRGRR